MYSVVTNPGPLSHFHHREHTYNDPIQNRPNRSRQRTMSTYSQSSVASSFSMRLGPDSPKTSPLSALAVWPGQNHASGSFTPTSSASASLQSLADSLNWVPLSLPRRTKRRPHGISLTFDALSNRNGEPSHTPSSPLSINSPASSISVPSISRTSSSFFASDAISEHLSASTGKSPKTVARTPITMEKPPIPHLRRISDKPQQTTQMDPILARLEKKSKFCAQTVRCATCNKSGRDYPRCGKCGEMWCSRECRLQGRKKHVCVV